MGSDYASEVCAARNESHVSLEGYDAAPPGASAAQISKAAQTALGNARQALSLIQEQVRAVSAGTVAHKTQPSNSVGSCKVVEHVFYNDCVQKQGLSGNQLVGTSYSSQQGTACACEG